MFNVGPWELILILSIALIVFGPGKLPEVGRSLGKTLQEFKKASTGIQQQIQKEVQEVGQPVNTVLSSNTNDVKVNAENEANKA